MTRVLRIAAGLVLAAAAVAGCGPGLQDFSIGRGVGGPTYPITAVFHDATGLPVGGRVELHDVTVGRVQSLSTRDFRAYVHMNVSRSVTLPVGTTATLALTTPLGEEYVELTPPPGSTQGTLSPGATIPASATSRAADVENLLSAFSAVLNGGGVDQIRTIVDQLDTALHGRTATGRRLVSRLNVVLGQLADHTAEVDRTLRSVADLSLQLAGQRSLIVRGLSQLQPGVAALHADTAGFTRLLHHISRVGRTATDVLDSVQVGLVADLNGLMPTLDTLTALRGRLGSTLAGLRKFALLLDRAIPGDYLNLTGNVVVGR